MDPITKICLRTEISPNSEINPVTKTCLRTEILPTTQIDIS